MYELLHESKVNINMIMLLCNLAALSSLLQNMRGIWLHECAPDHGAIHALDDVRSNTNNLSTVLPRPIFYHYIEFPSNNRDLYFRKLTFAVTKNAHILQTYEKSSSYHRPWQGSFFGATRKNFIFRYYLTWKMPIGRLIVS